MWNYDHSGKDTWKWNSATASSRKEYQFTFNIQVQLSVKLLLRPALELQFTIISQ
jgi:hypothetical protein